MNINRSTNALSGVPVLLYISNAKQLFLQRLKPLGSFQQPGLAIRFQETTQDQPAKRNKRIGAHRDCSMPVRVISRRAVDAP